MLHDNFSSPPAAVLITGGEEEGAGAGRAVSGVELYRPAHNTSCQLPSLPGYRSGHTLDGLVLCGGQDRAGDETKAREVFTITEKAHTRAFSWLKALLLMPV